MKKVLLLAALALGAASVSAQDSEASKNAVCITLKSGEAQYVAFTDKPLISATSDGLVVVNQETSKAVCTLTLADVETISATYHDFSTTGIGALSEETGRKVTAAYDLTGKKVERIEPGKVYVLKFSDGSTVKARK